MNTLELRRQRAALVEQARGVLSQASNENRDLNGEERAKWDAINADIDAMKARIEREERQESLEREMGESRREPNRPNGQAGRRDAQSLIGSDEYRDAFRASLVADIPQLGISLTNEQRSLLHEVRAQTVGTASSGGYTVPQGFHAEMEVALKSFGGVRAVASVMQTDAGNDIPWPTVNDTGNTGELIAENTSVNAQDLAFSSVTLKSYKYSSKTILVPFELLQDNAVNLESFIAQAAGERLGRIGNTHFTTGDNSSKPQGVVTFSTLGVTAAATAAITHSELIDLEHSVDPAYRKESSWMFNDAILKAVKKLVDSEGRPLWLPGVAVKEPDTILGYGYTINQDMATPAAAAKTVLFGAMKKYKVREVKAVQLYRIVDKYIESGQVGFLAFMRMDGRGVNGGTNPIKHLIQAAE